MSNGNLATSVESMTATRTQIFYLFFILIVSGYTHIWGMITGIEHIVVYTRASPKVVCATVYRADPYSYSVVRGYISLV